ncbi:MAG: PspC domain-containing protein [Bacteroidota bacterium]
MGDQQRRLYRSNTNRVLGGICGGIGEYLNVDPVVVRVVWIVLTLFGGSGILLYIIGLFVVPKNPEGGAVAPPSRGSGAVMLIGAIMIGIGLAILLDNLEIISFHHWWHRSWEFAFPAFLIALGLYLLAKKREPAPLGAASPGTNTPQGSVRRLHRSVQDKKIFGVCGGIGNYLDIDPTIVRLVYVAFTFLSFGAGVVLYFLLFLLLPEEPYPEVKKA